MKRDPGGALAQHRFETDELPVLIRQQEGRHRIAGPGRGVASTIVAKAGDKPVDGVGERPVELPRSIGEGLQAFTERCVKIATPSAEIARRIAEGTAHPDDNFVIIRWLAPGGDGELAGLRRAKNDLEGDRTAHCGSVPRGMGSHSEMSTGSDDCRRMARLLPMRFPGRKSGKKIGIKDGINILFRW